MRVETSSNLVLYLWHCTGRYHRGSSCKLYEASSDGPYERYSTVQIHTVRKELSRAFYLAAGFLKPLYRTIGSRKPL